MSPNHSYSSYSFREKILPEQVRPAIKLEASSLGSHLEYYRNTAASAFALPRHTHHWLIVQELYGPEDFLVQIGDAESDLGNALRADELIYIPPFTETEWDFSHVHGCLHMVVPDKLFLEVIVAQQLDNRHCLLAEFISMVGRQSRAICRHARVIMSAMRAAPRPCRLVLDEFLYTLAELMVDCQVGNWREREQRMSGVRQCIPVQKMQRLRDYIEAYVDTDIGIEDLSGVVHMSGYYFSRCFKKTTGCTPYQYVTRVRVARARDMLCRSQLGLGDVAYACGFSDQPHMTRVFKKICGVTPGVYRKMMLG